MNSEPTNRTPFERIGTARLRRALLLAVARGLTKDEAAGITNHTNPKDALIRAVSGAGFRLERVRICRPGELLEQQVYRVGSRDNALRLIQLANRCADSYGYTRISEHEAAEILEQYPVDTE